MFSGNAGSCIERPKGDSVKARAVDGHVMCLTDLLLETINHFL